MQGIGNDNTDHPHPPIAIALFKSVRDAFSRVPGRILQVGKTTQRHV
jgi:hypothetical protein